MSEPDMKDVVREKYGQAALRAKAGGSSCCGASASCCSDDPITSNLYDSLQATEIPAEALQASLGCGNPTALAKLRIRRRHRRAAVRKACRPQRQSLRPRYDRRDAGARQREQAQSGPGKC